MSLNDVHINRLLTNKTYRHLKNKPDLRANESLNARHWIASLLMLSRLEMLELCDRENESVLSVGHKDRDRT